MEATKGAGGREWMMSRTEKSRGGDENVLLLKYERCQSNWHLQTPRTAHILPSPEGSQRPWKTSPDFSLPLSSAWSPEWKTESSVFLEIISTDPQSLWIQSSSMKSRDLPVPTYSFYKDAGRVESVLKSQFFPLLYTVFVFNGICSSISSWQVLFQGFMSPCSFSLQWEVLI